MNCANCKHWGRWTYQDLGTCRKVVRFWEIHEDGYDEDYHRNNSKFFVQDGEDWSAALFTRPDFGCTEHEGVVVDDEFNKAEDKRANDYLGITALQDFYDEVRQLTVNHDVENDTAVVYISKLGRALSRVDPKWWEVKP